MASPPQAVPEFVRLAAHPLRWRLLTGLAGGDLRVRELMALTEEPQSLVSYHLRLLRQGGLVSARRSSFDARDSYYSLDLDGCADALADVGAALHPALRREIRPVGRTDLKVLFVCTGNSARSPIAEALLRHHTAGRLTVTSAGSLPKPQIHPDAVRVLRERGIDITAQRPRHLDTLRDRHFDYVISLCDKAREICPEFGDDAHRIHWSIPDPAREDHPERAFDRAATNIDTRIRYLLPVLAEERHP
ncbi:ArsR family transcriptional regulator [Actinocorallia sp. API 0066]|uniref:arsenate reductase/protein-tyrosine-phosphatase family protein n=1 Tax=Actinocorallia sp. API 0066 TaxID=2896846 RepID=UPI001E3D33E8|nr:ArsR family transcriptional regulator [Actinocorallia sp. API 0066]MCD0448666.1 ArsR family transcriptional regulator [Actinocorallia sp. API 0066]